jgi:hypothetical protein
MPAKTHSSETGKAMIDLVLSSPNGQGMQAYHLSPGDVLNITGFSAGFESGENTSIRFFMRDDELFMTSVSGIEESTMARQESVSITPGDTVTGKKNVFIWFWRFPVFNPGIFIRVLFFTAIKIQLKRTKMPYWFKFPMFRPANHPGIWPSAATPDTVHFQIGKEML